jgi:hypothetical protein
MQSMTPNYIKSTITLIHNSEIPRKSCRNERLDTKAT